VAVGSCRKTPLGNRISLQISKGQSDLATNTKGQSNLATKPLMNGHISPQTTKNQKNTKYMILILIFFFFLSWAGDEGEREKKNWDD
jgi:hypothetical protein